MEELQNFKSIEFFWKYNDLGLWDLFIKDVMSRYNASQWGWEVERWNDIEGVEKLIFLLDIIYEHPLYCFHNALARLSKLLWFFHANDLHQQQHSPAVLRCIERLFSCSEVSTQKLVERLTEKFEFWLLTSTAIIRLVK